MEFFVALVLTEGHKKNATKSFNVDVAVMVWETCLWHELKTLKLIFVSDVNDDSLISIFKKPYY